MKMLGHMGHIRKAIFYLLIIGIFLCNSMGMAQAAPATDYYISPTGSNSWNGSSATFSLPDNGPWLTFEHAVGVSGITPPEGTPTTLWLVDTGGPVTFGAASLPASGNDIQFLNPDWDGLTVASMSGDPTNCIIDWATGSIINSKFSIAGVGSSSPYRGIKFKGITFIGASGGGVIASDLSSKVYIEDCIFDSNTCTSSGGAINSQRSSLYVSGSQTEFTANVANGAGGAIYFLGDSTDVISIQDATFIDNRSCDYGGAIQATLVSTNTVTFSNLTFERNEANKIQDVYGGAVDLSISSGTVTTPFTSCNFDDNTATIPVGATSKTSYGGALSLRGVTAQIDNCNFSRNEASSLDPTGRSYGGAISLSTGSSADLNNCTFDQNEATAPGEAPPLHGKSYGGAISLATGSSASLDTCTFTTNVARDAGGGAYSYGSTFSANTSTFSGNITTNATSAFIYNNINQGGGALYFENQGFTIDHCQFVENNFSGTAAGIGLGGAILAHFASGLTAVMDISDSTFTGNKASGGGALAVGAHTSSGSYTLNLSNDTFDSNSILFESTLSCGGAILLSRAPLFLGSGYAQIFPNISSCSFLNNKAEAATGATATALGGAMATWYCGNASGMTALTKDWFYGNQAISDLAAYGGAVISTESFNFKIVSNCLFAGNQAVYTGTSSPIPSIGGAFVVNDSSVSAIGLDNDFVNCTFNQNSASFGAAGFFAGKTGDTLDLTNCIFNNNGDVSTYGAIFVPVAAGIALPTITYSDFYHNSGNDLYDGSDPPITYDYNSLTTLGWGGTGCHGGDPAFNNPTYSSVTNPGDYHLTSGSACRNTGDDSVSLTDDIVGTWRPQETHKDIGAYEFIYTPPPIHHSAVINGGAATTSSPNVTLTLSCDSGAQMLISGDVVGEGTRIPFATSHATTLTSGAGLKTVRVEFFDSHGHSLGSNSPSITLSASPPPTATVVINSGAEYSNVPAVTLTINDGDATEMIVGNSTFSGSSWEPFNTTKNWTFDADNGTKTIYVKTRNSGGESSPASDSIILDSLAPTPTSGLTLNGLAGHSGDFIGGGTGLTIGATDALSGVASARAMIGTQEVSATYSSGTVSATLPDSLADGTYDLTVLATDQAGNEGTLATLSGLMVSSEFILKDVIAYPNPASSSLIVSFMVSKGGSGGVIKIYNLNGLLIRSESLGSYAPGFNSVTIDVSDLPAAAYIGLASLGSQGTGKFKFGVIH